VAKRIAIHRQNRRITEREEDKSRLDMDAVQNLIKPNAVMFDPLQKSNLIGFLTNKDTYLMKLITMHSVYLDQTKSCNCMI